MVRSGDRVVFKQPDGQWANKREGEESPETLHETQREAVAAARWFLTHHCGGNLTVMDEQGRVEFSSAVQQVR